MRHAKFFVGLALAACVYAAGYQFPFQDPSLPIDERVDNLMSLLTLEEKVAQMSHGGDQYNGPAPAILRLGINPFQWGTECLRGDVDAGLATAFPQALGLAATFNTALINAMANATAVEVRAKYNNYTHYGDFGYHMGLACWSPVINIFRQPLWGRGQETYGEDPYLTGQMTNAFVTGLQGTAETLATIAACKHFDAYCGPENVPVSRLSFNAVVELHDLAMTFFPAWEACVAAGARAVMCSYNAVNGVPSCANEFLMTEMLRDTWGFAGYVVSDQDALEFVTWEHNYTSSLMEGAIAANTAGVDLEDSDWSNNTFALLLNATNQGLLSQTYIDASIERLFTARMLLGEFNPPEMNPYANLNLSQVNSPAHQQLAVEAVQQSIVLLRNEGNLLPLDATTIKRVCVMGPQANFSDGLMGDYSPIPAFVITPLEGIATYLENMPGDVTYAAGCAGPDVYCPSFNSTAVDECAAGADVIILCMGLSTAIESEGNDRHNISLPGMQDALIAYAESLAVPTVLVLFNAGPVDVSASTSPSMLAAFYPAQATGQGLANVLFGDYNPGGRLPVTWPASMDQIPPMTNYTMVGRTYRYFEGDPLFPFGYGLSYTTFEYSNLFTGAALIDACDSVMIQVDVQNTGRVAGSEVVQLYMAWPNATAPVPTRQLVGFERVFLLPGNSTTVTFWVTPRLMSYVLANSTEWIIEAGTRDFWVGGQQPFQMLTVPSNILQANFDVVGPVTPLLWCGIDQAERALLKRQL